MKRFEEMKYKLFPRLSRKHFKGEYQYLDLCRHILKNGVRKEDRTGTGTISIFGYQMRFDMSDGFPLLTTKDIDVTKIWGELFAFVHGVTNAKVMGDDYGFKIWKKWQLDENGDLGPIYGKQWRAWAKRVQFGSAPESYEVQYIDQLQNVIDEIKTNPDGRRHIVSAWNVAELGEMALPPCHLLFQFYVAEGKLSLQLYQRSGDVFLGIPYNIASYATLLHMVAHLTDLEPGEFVHTIGDAHLYLNHIDQIKKQLKRKPRTLPTLSVNENVECINDYWFTDLELSGYNPHPKIKGDVSV